MFNSEEHRIHTLYNIHKYLSEISFIHKFSDEIKDMYLDTDASQFDNEGEYLKISNTIKEKTDNVHAFMEHNTPKIISGRIILREAGLSEKDEKDAYEDWIKETEKIFEGNFQGSI